MLLWESRSPLNEAKSAPLYHVTDIDHFYMIAKSNKLIATPNQAKRAYDTRDKVSFSRSSDHFGGDVKIVIDQDKLAQNYSISPINVHPDPTRKNGSRSKLYRSQSEERVHRDITNLLKYVKKVYVWDLFSEDELKVNDVPKAWLDKVEFVPDINGPSCK